MQTKEQLLQTLLDNGSRIARLMASCMINQDSQPRLSASQGEVLMIVSHRGPLPLSELAKTMRLTPGAISQLVEGLERNELVVRQPSLEDRRVTNVAATRGGQQRIAALQKHKSVIFEAVYKELSIDELQIMAKVQAKMIDHLKQVASEKKE